MNRAKTIALCGLGICCNASLWCGGMGCLGVQQNLLRSRRLNINAGMDLDVKDTSTDTLGVLLSEDRIRAMRFSVDVSRQDKWDGINSVSLKLSRGLNILDATETGVRDLSRAEGRSDFTKLESSLSRYQLLGENFRLFTSVRGQYAWSPLLSAEEFGYGGESFGWAYDPSELLGDHGVIGGVELSYQSIEMPFVKNFRLEPFIFYDIGKVWNMDTGAGEARSGASVGGGIKFMQAAGFTGEFTVALPLIHATTTTLYGNGKNPRYLLQFSYSF